MDYVIKKTYLGLAVDKVVEELGLQRVQKEVNTCLREAFNNHYALVKESSHQNKTVSISGLQHKMKESPVGHGD